MNYANKFFRFILNKKYRESILSKKGFYNFIEDEKFLKKRFKTIFNYELNLDNPLTFNEKLNYLKIFDRNDLYTKLADKILVKEFVANKIGEEYVIPLYEIYDNVNDINLKQLPNEFVLKCNHDSGGAFICKDKREFELKKVQRKLKRNLKRNWFWSSREWPYKNIKAKILAEKYIKDPTSEDLIDYKFLCFNGQPKFVYTTVKNSNIYENYYDMNFNKVLINHGFPRRNPEFKKPINFDLMVKLVKVLCKDIPFVRIDMHNINGKIYFGEFTFYDWGGMRPYPQSETDTMLGSLLNVKNIKL